MQARKCDRCGTYYNTYMGDKSRMLSANGLKMILISGNSYSSHSLLTRYDLCPDCMRLLADFLKCRGRFEIVKDGGEKRE